MSESNTYTSLFSKGANTSREHGEMPITTHTYQLEFANTSLPTLVCRLKAALQRF